MSNPWIQHVKSFASRHGIAYGCAISDPKCKVSYSNVKKEGFQMGAEDVNVKPVIRNFRKLKKKPEPPPPSKPPTRPPSSTLTQTEKNKIIADYFDDPHIPILMYQNNQKMYEDIEKKVEELVKKNHPVSLIHLLFFTKPINQLLFKKWNEDLVMYQLGKIVKYINSDADPFVGDIRMIYRYYKKPTIKS